MPRFTLRILVSLLTFGIGLATTSAVWYAMRPAPAQSRAEFVFQRQPETPPAPSTGCTIKASPVDDHAYAISSSTPANMTVEGGILNAKALDKRAPAYPPIAKAARASGTVAVQVLVDESGRVVSANAVSGHPLLRQSAEAAAREVRFSPTLLSGRPLQVSGLLTYYFKLQ